MNALEKAFDRSNALINTSFETAMSLKASGMLEAMVPTASTFGYGSDWQTNVKNQSSYAMFRSWVYAAVNAVASEAACQPVNVGKLKKENKKQPGKTKEWLLDKLPKNTRSKAATKELEIIPDHPLQKVLERPNPMQYRFQFVYSIVANLNLTGRAYIVMDQGENGTEFYALPTSWVRPDHKEGPFSKFYIVNPREAASQQNNKPLDASQVMMIHLPNPADPLGAMSPASCQSAAIRVDDRIQTVQEKFFDNGIFPSVIVTVGKDPHPDVPEGIRPRLTGVQRRQVIGAIRRVMGGVANFGNPAIVDGLIEGIERLSSTQNELGWDKSEDKLKVRILSAFCVHPFILGEAMNVGGYSQSVTIMNRFYARVNVFLDLLSTVMTYFIKENAKDIEEVDEETVVWWEALKAIDPTLDNAQWQFARTNGDVTQNEYRARLGLPPDDSEMQLAPPITTAIVQLLPLISQGAAKPDQLIAILEGNGVDTALAKRIAGPEMPPPPPPAPAPGQEQVPGKIPPGKPAFGKPKEPLPAATEELKKAIDVLRTDPEVLVDDIMRKLSYQPDPLEPVLG